MTVVLAKRFGEHIEGCCQSNVNCSPRWAT